jgi:ABC-type phosphate transport system substrate-binding protein
MGIYKRARHIAVAVACASPLVLAGLGTAAPGSAFATVTCKSPLKASGSSLQGEQQGTWATAISTKLIGECSADISLEYTSTSSGRGLNEFALVGELKEGEKPTLKPSEAGTSGFDGFIGTDDPPTTTQLTHAKEASESEAVTVPVVAAPVAVIGHLPAGCKATGVEEVSNKHLSEEFDGKELSWETLLGKGNLKEGSSEGCKAKPVVEARSDESGTSFAFKQYLCQTEPVVWVNKAGAVESECQAGVKGSFVTDASTWPVEAKVSKEHANKKGETPLKKNEKSSGEAEAVEFTGAGATSGELEGEATGSIGYVNLANAHAAGFANATSEATKFWTDVANKTSPETTTGELGACPNEFSLTSTVVKEAEEDHWSTVHLANKGQATGAYPLCTLTYDVAWANYKTTKLESSEEYGSAAKAEEVANSAKAYLGKAGYVLEAGQSELHHFYAKLPTESSGAKTILALAKKAGEKVG